MLLCWLCAGCVRVTLVYTLWAQREAGRGKIRLTLNLGVTLNSGRRILNELWVDETTLYAELAERVTKEEYKAIYENMKVRQADDGTNAYATHRNGTPPLVGPSTQGTLARFTHGTPRDPCQVRLQAYRGPHRQAGQCTE